MKTTLPAVTSVTPALPDLPVTKTFPVMEALPLIAQGVNAWKEYAMAESEQKTRQMAIREQANLETERIRAANEAECQRQEKSFRKDMKRLELLDKLTDSPNLERDSAVYDICMELLRQLNNDI